MGKTIATNRKARHDFSVEEGEGIADLVAAHPQGLMFYGADDAV